MKPTLLVLAAGMGSRYGGLKQLDKLGPGGETIIDYSVYDAIRAGFGKVVFIIRESLEQDFKELVISKFAGKIDTEYVFQELSDIPDGLTVAKDRTKPWGTGHAVLVAKDAIKEPFAVINADDFYGAESFQLAANFLNKVDPSSSDYCMVGYLVKNTLSDFGSVSRGVCQVDANHFLYDIVERTNIEKIEGAAVFHDESNKEVKLAEDTTVSMNFWGFSPTIFDHLNRYFTEFIKQNANNPKAEFYIPTPVNTLIKNNLGSIKVLTTNAKWFGITYQEDRPEVVQSIRNLVKEGKYPAKLWS